ncbi:hypothetical protein V6N12_057006 [Hibiscus sabdariffa]|uniref:Uncharacterized protein n=1 Tax=Hibiscus sabdariffa TaxID=183260 RepID=A0ABR2DCQ8_9ROSI
MAENFFSSCSKVFRVWRKERGINASDVHVTTNTSTPCVFRSAPLHVNPKGDNCEQIPNDDIVQRVEPLPIAGTPLDPVSSKTVVGNSNIHANDDVSGQVCLDADDSINVEPPEALPTLRNDAFEPIDLPQSSTMHSGVNSHPMITRSKREYKRFLFAHLADKDNLDAVGGHKNRAVGPTRTMLKVHEVENSMLSDPKNDLSSKLSMLKRFEEALRFLGDN